MSFAFFNLTRKFISVLTVLFKESWSPEVHSLEVERFHFLYNRSRLEIESINDEVI